MTDVFLHIYDLSNGIAAQLSRQLTGRHFKAIYHTAVVVHGREYYFGGNGIESSLPDETPYGRTIERKYMGSTDISDTVWQEFLRTIRKDYSVGTYHLLEHNCNTFSNAACQFLVGCEIPGEIVALPKEFLETPLGLMLRPQIDAMYGRHSLAAHGQQGLSISQPQVLYARRRQGYQDHPDLIFNAKPTLSKLCNTLLSAMSDMQIDAVEHVLAALFDGRQPSASDFILLLTELKRFFDRVPPADSFPALDVLRLIALDKEAAQRIPAALFEQVVSIQAAVEHESPTSEKTLLVLMRLIANATSTTYPRISRAMSAGDGYPLLGRGIASHSRLTSKAALIAALGILLHDKSATKVEDAFALGIATALAERIDMNLTAATNPLVEAWSSSEVDLARRVVQELTPRTDQDVGELLESFEL
ncbi:hypothetical protein PYCC9005_002150 [Savitreella phatthalungensis]